MITERDAAVITAYTGYTFGDFGNARAYMQELMAKDSSVDPFFNPDSVKDASKPDFIAIVVDDETGVTKREAAIITAFTGYCIGNFGDAHEYMEEIMGRPIWTHELGSAGAWDEIREKARPDFVALSESIV